MPLISQPGSDYQLAEITIDAGNARDIMLLLLDAHAVLDHLYLDGTQPGITAPAEDYLRQSASPYTLPALIDALSEVISTLTRAIRDADPFARPAVPSQLIGRRSHLRACGAPPPDQLRSTETVSFDPTR